MEINICEKKPSICLNMIVKNESHIIRQTLEMLCSKIDFSYWVICDTGSTDNTPEIINTFFQGKNICGELHNHEWKNFAHNRTLALNEAFNKTDLLFVFDADDEIHGDLIIPNTVDADGYYLNFGNSSGISYQRTLLVYNRIKWDFKSVIHEYIDCLKPNPTFKTIEGNYYVVSGRKGSRNSDPDKYLKDAIILEDAYYEAKKTNNNLYLRYGFYCANSYRDAGQVNDAIKWYKITLSNNNWHQEKYMCCYFLFQLYLKKDEKDYGLRYLVESFKYDCERLECVAMIAQHFVCDDPFIVYHYYNKVRTFYETQFLNSNNNGKLFVKVDKSNFILPYYIIFSADKVKEEIPHAHNTISKMFEIIFTKKYPINSDFYIRNLLYNLQFFIERCIQHNDKFIELFQSYITFLKSTNVNLSNYDFLKKYEKYGVFIN